MNITDIEHHQMESLKRIVESNGFKEDLKEVENYIQEHYEQLHYHWGIKNKLKLAAERLVRFHVWKNFGMVQLYNTPLSSDVAFILNDCVINIDCKTIDMDGNAGDAKYIQCEQNQANFENNNLSPTPIPLTDLVYEGASFYPILEKYHDDKPVLSFFVFINYRDNGTAFNLEGLEICCLPHNEVVESEFNSEIIQNYKTYKYLNENQAVKYDTYYSPVKIKKDHWIEFKVGSTTRYYDNKMKHPFDNNKLLVWGKIAKSYKVVIGGHTIRVNKSTIAKRRNSKNYEWDGWVKIQL